MDYEKKYNEALERAQKQRADYQKELDKTDKNSQLAGLLRAGISAIDMAFPELAESEDERIRKGLVKLLTVAGEAYVVKSTGIEKGTYLAYLEKQKEQKPAEWSEDYQEEDIQTRFAFYTYKDDSSVLYLSNVFVEEASRNHGFGTRILRAAEKVAETIGATTISLKVKQDSPANAWYRKNGYGYVAFEDGYDWLEKNLEYMKPNKQEWSEEDKSFYNSIMCEVIKEGMHPTPAQANWLKSLPEKFVFQPKNEWSEEDENILDGIIVTLDRLGFAEYCKSSRDQDIEEERLYYKEIQCLKKIKSLRHQTHWKPSEEQMEALDNARFCKSYDRTELDSLYEQLKKL